MSAARLGRAIATLAFAGAAACACTAKPARAPMAAATPPAPTTSTTTLTPTLTTTLTTSPTSASPSTAERSPSPPEPVAPPAPTAAAPPLEQTMPKKPEHRWRAWTEFVRVDRDARTVELDAVSVLETGFLEQLVCGVSTREHESLFAFAGKASDLHAALLFAGLEPGAPGGWRERPEDDGSVAIDELPPTGERLRIEVLLPDGAIRPIEWFTRASPLVERAENEAEPVLPHAFVFAGSRFVTNRRTGVERYAADASGSIVGLVTFGDEVIGYLDVISPSIDVDPQLWEAWPERMPKPGTAVRIRISPVEPDAPDRSR